MRIFLALFIVISLSAPALAQSVVDGDTLYVGSVKYRLCGIDAPEHGHPGYHQATDYLHSLVRGKTVKCTPVGQGTPCDGRSKTRNHDRIVAQCFVDGEDLAAEMVRAGYAKDWPKFSGGYYGR
jgi:endonuclease YncB( thermonuclease family)